ncbi:MAG: aldo/keto reductase family protein [Phycisphaerales bacterium]
MEYRRVGNSGLRVSAVSIGGWLTFGAGVDEQGTARVLGAALDGGVNFIDLADAYAKGEAERATGAFIRGRKRSELVLSSKLFWPMSDDPNDRGLSRKHIMESIDRTLSNLGTDYLDLYFCHREDPETPLEETVRAMDDLVRRGKVLYWGTSVWSGRSLKAAQAAAERFNAHPPIVEQPQFNLIHRGNERDSMPTATKLGMGLVVWSPLAGGLLTGKYNAGVPTGSRGDTTKWLREDLTEANLTRVREFCGIAKELGALPAQLALAWILGRPGITSVITGATTPQQVRDNIGAAAVKVPAEAERRIARLFPPA